MNFFSRNSTKIPTPLAKPLGTRIEIEFNEMDLPKIRLRGSIFFDGPRPLANPRSSKTSGKTIALCYRGSTYERELPTPPVKTNETATTLTHRGSTYACQLPIPAVETEGETVVLIYRGHTERAQTSTPSTLPTAPCD